LKKPKYPKKTTDLPKVITKLDNTMLHRLHLSMGGPRTHQVSGDRH
jgi:hypothetical protein